jgi:hypothetical protein
LAWFKKWCLWAENLSKLSKYLWQSTLMYCHTNIVQCIMTNIYPMWPDGRGEHFQWLFKLHPWLYPFCGRLSTGKKYVQKLIFGP